MGLIGDVIKSLADGFIASASHQVNTGNIDHLCDELGWPVERDGDAVRLRFHDPQGQVRTLSIYSDSSGIPLFALSSQGRLRAVPVGIAEYLLGRATDIPFAAWSVARDDNGVTFILLYQALGQGLTAPSLRSICGVLPASLHESSRLIC